MACVAGGAALTGPTKSPDLMSALTSGAKGISGGVMRNGSARTVAHIRPHGVRCKTLLNRNTAQHILNGFTLSSPIAAARVIGADRSRNLSNNRQQQLAII